MNKKADGGLTAIVIILIIVVFLGWLVNVGGRECRTNKDCGEDNYCGSDFACHKFPVIEKEYKSGNYIVPALIIGIALIVTAVILRWDKLGLSERFRKKPKENKGESVHYNYPLYYTEQVKSK
jgi:hypothetical protein